MSLDLSAAIEAVEDDLQDRAGMGHAQVRHYYATLAVTAAAPLIEAAVRAQVAAEIRAARLALIPGEYAPGHYAGLAQAERIAGDGRP